MSSTLFNLTEATSLISGDAFYLVRGADTAGNDRWFDIATLDEHIQDLMSTTLVAGSNISVVYNDAGGTITISYTGATPAATTDDLPEGVSNFYFHGLSGDVTVTAAAGPGAAAATIANDVVTNAKLANMVEATIKGRPAGAGSGDPVDLTGAQARDILSVQVAASANTTYYVRSDGSDSNDGLSDTAGGAFLTVQKAIDTVYTVNWRGFTATIKLSGPTPRTITENMIFIGEPTGIKTFTLDGSVTTPTDFVLTSASGSTLVATAGAVIAVRGVKIQAVGADGILVEKGSTLVLNGNVEFGVCGRWHMSADGSGSAITISSGYGISGGAARHINLSANASLANFTASTVTLTGTPAFSSAFVNVIGGAYIGWNSGAVTFSGAATGSRYSVTLNAILNSFGGGATYFPGSTAGSTATGGQYA